MENKFVSVKNLKVIGKGQCGNVYQLSDNQIIKIFNSFIPMESIEKERNNASMVHEMGIPSAEVYDIVDTEEGKGLIYEYINAGSLQQLMKEKPENMEAYSERLGKLCRKVHNTNVEGKGFYSAKKEFLDRLEASKELIVDLYDMETYSKIEKLILSVPDGSGLVHGDFHPDNVLIKNNEFILIDLADVMIGHPIFDLLSLYFLRVNKSVLFDAVRENLDNIHDAEDRNHAIAILEKHKTRSSTFSDTESAAFWKGFSKGYFADKNQEYIDKMTRLIDGFSYLYLAEATRSEGSFGKTIVRIGTKEGVKVLLERYDELMQLSQVFEL